MKNIFLDKCEWKNGKLLIKKLKLPEKGYELWVFRSLASGGKQIILVSYLFLSCFSFSYCGLNLCSYCIPFPTFASFPAVLPFRLRSC
jgi:hypothetical protein